MNRARAHRDSGFSLIEVLVYVVILTLMLLTTIAILFNYSDSYHQFVLDRRINSTASTVLERIVRETRGSMEVVVAQSTLGAHPGVLTLSGPDADGDTVVHKFAIENGAVTLRQDGALLGPLSLSSVTIPNLVFTRLTTASAEGIRVEITVRASYQDLTREKSFSTFVFLRGSVE